MVAAASASGCGALVGRGWGREVINYNLAPARILGIFCWAGRWWWTFYCEDYDADITSYINNKQHGFSLLELFIGIATLLYKKFVCPKMFTDHEVFILYHALGLHDFVWTSKMKFLCYAHPPLKYLHNIKTTSQVTSSLILQGGRTSVIFPLAQIFFFFSKKTKNLMTKPLVFLYFIQEACQLLAIWQISWFCLFQQFWWNISTSCFRLSVISLSYWPKFG